MSFARTYVHSVLVGLDDFGAAVFFNRNDVTISTLCRIVQLARAKDAGGEWALKQLGLWKWQYVVLAWLGPFLNDLQTNHCEKARLADIQRAKRILTLLDGAAGDPHVN